MADEPDGSRGTPGTARTAIPALRELLGDFTSIPLFRDMAATCERATVAGTLAWPMPLPFPAQPPAAPQFAPLGALFCNHLGHLLLRAAKAKDAAGLPGGCAALLAFFGAAATCHARALPQGDRPGYAVEVLERVGQAMRVAHPDEACWQDFETKERARAPSGSLRAGELDDGLMQLPALGAGHGLEDAAWRLYARFAAAPR